MALFELGEFILSSGQKSNFKINCDALSFQDWRTLAWLLVKRLPKFGEVEGVPRGGIPLANALKPFRSPSKTLLIVDDVLTTGNSMEKLRAGREAIGAVIFARNEPARWIIPL